MQGGQKTWKPGKTWNLRDFEKNLEKYRILNKRPEILNNLNMINGKISI